MRLPRMSQMTRLASRDAIVEVAPRKSETAGPMKPKVDGEGPAQPGRWRFWRKGLLGACAAAAGLYALTPVPRGLCSKTLCVIAFGDSLSAGTGLAKEDGFPAALNAKLRAEGYPVEVLNGGVGGDTSAKGLARLKEAMKARADVAIVEFGANDLLKGVAPAALRQNLEAMVAGFQSGNTRVLLAGFRLAKAPPPLRNPAFDAVYPEVAGRFGIALHPYFLRATMTEEHVLTDLLQSDGAHPNAKGVRKIVEDVAPFVERELDAVLSARAQR